jgi:flagellar protein FliS
MNATNRNAVNAYAQVGVETGVAGASPHKLILMLFDGAIKALVSARLAMVKGEIGPKCQALSNAVAIIQDGLQLNLDVEAGGEVAKNLDALYEYMCSRLLIANMKNQVEPIDEVGRLLVDLKKAWVAIEQTQAQPKQSSMSAAENTPPQRTTALSYGKA